MDKKVVITGVISLILGGAAVMAFKSWESSDKENIDELKAQLEVLQRRDKQSAVLQSVSKQMEEIAYEQKKISDEQREEAEEQTKVANEMRQRSEEERHNAIIAQQKALESERMALNALGRSLGALALTQFRAGNQEIGDLLSYASYLYTERYHGDVYYPAIYQALSQSSQSKDEWNRHSDAVYNLEFMPKSDNKLVSISSYGEILYHEVSGNQLKTTTLFKDRNYDFRDILINQNNNTIYAISRNGYLYIKNGNDVKFLEVPLVRPFKIQTCLDERYLLLSGETNLALFDQTTNTIVGTKELDYKVVLSARLEHMPLLFDDKGRMHIVKDLNNIETRKIPVSGQVTAFASSNSSGLEAFGMKDGTIYLYDKNKNVRKLVGHRSRISRIRIYQNRIFSSSYDGSINLWISSNEKMEPITLYTSNNWIIYFNYDRSKNYLWLGDQKGSLSQVLISVPMMVERIKHKLKRNFTQDEWNYYIGKNIPYETFISTKGKEAKR